MTATVAEAWECSGREIENAKRTKTTGAHTQSIFTYYGTQIVHASCIIGASVFRLALARLVKS